MKWEYHHKGKCPVCGAQDAAVGFSKCCSKFMCESCYPEHHVHKGGSELPEEVKEFQQWFDANMGKLNTAVEEFIPMLDAVIKNVAVATAPPLLLFQEPLATIARTCFAIGYHAKEKKSKLDIPIPDVFKDAFNEKA